MPPDGRAILHGAGGVVALELAEDHIAAPLAINARQAGEPHQWGVADQVFERGVNGLLLGHANSQQMGVWFALETAALHRTGKH
jgi:hypothetical protein